MTSSSSPVSDSLASVLARSPAIFTPLIGGLIDGTIVQIDKTKIVIDIGGLATGIVHGKELKLSREIIEKLHIGDAVQAIVVDEEDSDGVLPVSLRRASQRKVWDDYIKAYKEGTPIQVRTTEANKGGLIAALEGFKGFLPLSQLAPMHYPRVEGGSSELIYQKLLELVGKTFTVKIINIDENQKKLVLSERGALEGERSQSLSNLETGQVVKGKISGIVSYGIFVTFNGLEGLVHISEIDWGHVNDPTQYGKVGDEIDVMIIGLDSEKLSLSIKRLKNDPWAELAKKYKINDVVEGTVTRVTPFGAFLRLDEGVNGLVHLSEISNELVRDTGKYLEVGEKKKAKIITFDLEERRIGLSIKAIESSEGGSEEAPKQKKIKKLEEDTSVAEESTEDSSEEEKKPKHAPGAQQGKKTTKKSSDE